MLRRSCWRWDFGGTHGYPVFGCWFQSSTRDGGQCHRLKSSVPDIDQLEHHICSCPRTTGWWFGTMEFYDFPYPGNVIIPTDELIFFRGVGIPGYTTNQTKCVREFSCRTGHINKFINSNSIPSLTCLQFLGWQLSRLLQRWSVPSLLEKAPPADLVSFEAERCLKMFEVFRLDMDKGLGEPLRNWMIFKLSRSFTFIYCWLCLAVWRVFVCFPIGNPSFQGRFCCVFLKQFKYCAFFLDVFGLLLESSGGFNLVDPLMFLGQEESKGSGRPSFIVFKNDLLSGYQSTRNNCIDHTYPGIWIHMYTLYTMENMEMGLSRKTMENHLASV